MRMVSETVSNAAKRSRRMRAILSSLARVMQMLFMAVVRGVSVLWLGLKPD